MTSSSMRNEISSQRRRVTRKYAMRSTAFVCLRAVNLNNAQGCLTVVLRYGYSFFFALFKSLPRLVLALLLPFTQAFGPIIVSVWFVSDRSDQAVFLRAIAKRIYRYFKACFASYLTHSHKANVDTVTLLLIYIRLDGIYY